MTVRISLYDFYAYTIPGFLYLTDVLIILLLLGIVQFDFQFINQISGTLLTFMFLGLTGLAYMLGQLLDPVAEAWFLIFERIKPSERQFKEYQVRLKEYSSSTQPPKASDWPILLAYLRNHNNNEEVIPDRFNATNYMLKNISLGFLLMFLILLVGMLLSDFDSIMLALTAAAGLGCLLARNRSVEFKNWFYSSLYEAYIANQMNDSRFRQLDKINQKENGEKPLQEDQVPEPSASRNKT